MLMNQEGDEDHREDAKKHRDAGEMVLGLDKGADKEHLDWVGGQSVA